MKRLTIRIPEDLHSKLTEYARTYQTSINAVVTDAITSYINREDWRFIAMSILGIEPTKINYIIQHTGENAISLICRYSKVPLEVTGWGLASIEVTIRDSDKPVTIPVPRGMRPQQVIALIGEYLARHKAAKLVEDLL